MGRSRKVQPSGPDGHYQLPHPDLICVPEELLDQTRRDLTAYIATWEKLGLQAAQMARDLADLERSGGCPPDLAAAIFDVVHNFGQLSTARPRARDVLDDDDVQVVEYRASSSSRGSCQRGVTQSHDTTTLVQHLDQLGFVRAQAFVARHGPQRVQQALDYLLSKSPQSILNPTGFLKILVESPEAIPKPYRKGTVKWLPTDYTGGKYGHVVQK